jgi:heat shock protein HtpX
MRDESSQDDCASEGVGSLLVVIGGFFGGKTGAAVALAIALAMNFGSCWFSDRMVLRMYHAHQVTGSDAPDLHRLE